MNEEDPKRKTMNEKETERRSQAPLHLVVRLQSF